MPLDSDAFSEIVVFVLDCLICVCEREIQSVRVSEYVCVSAYVCV